MVATDVIKEYLVRLGFDVDNPTQARVRQALKELENSISALSKNQATNILIKGMLGYVGAVAAAVTATTALMNKVAETDLEYQKIALRMHMTTDTAKQLTIAQKALGASLEEIVWNPELRSHYHELRQIVQAAGPPADAREQFQFIRSVGFELTKLKVTGQMVVENVVYRLAKMLGRDMKELKKWLTDLRKWIIDNLPEISQKIAALLKRVLDLGQSLIFIIKGIYTGIKNVVNVLPDAAKGIVALIAAIALGLKLNPTLVAIAGFFLLIEDFYKWKEAHRLGLDPKDYSGLSELWESLEGTFDILSGSLETLKKSFAGIDGDLLKIGLWETFATVLGTVSSMISTVALGITTIVTAADFIATKKARKDKAHMEHAWELGELDRKKREKKITPEQYDAELEILKKKSKLEIATIEATTLDQTLFAMNDYVRTYLDTGKKAVFGQYADNYQTQSSAGKQDIERKKAKAVTPSNAPQIPANISPEDAKRYGVPKKFAEAVNADKTAGYDSTYTYWDIAINGDIILPNVRNFTDLPAELQKKARENKNMQSIK